MVRLDQMCLAGVRGGGFDDVRINRALRQPLDARNFGRLLFEHFDEAAPDGLALVLGIAQSLKRREHALARIHHRYAHAQPPEAVHHLLSLVQAQQAVIHENAMQALGHGFLQQHREHRRIDAPGQGQQDVPLPRRPANFLYGALGYRGGRPVAAQATDLMHEAFDHLLAVPGMGDLGVELHSEHTSAPVGNRGQRRVVTLGDALKTFRKPVYVVAVAHPHIQRFFRQSGKQVVLRRHTHFGGAELGLVGEFHAAAELMGDGLHSVADTQHRLSQVEDALRNPGRAPAGNRKGSAGKDDARRCELAHGLVARVPGHDLGIDSRLADPAGNQLRGLRSEVKDQDTSLCHARPR